MGGGVGGLAAAVALQAGGASVTVFERGRRARQGVALLVWGNAMKALASLGVADALLELGAPIEHTHVRGTDGQLLSSLPVGEWNKRPGLPTIAVRRGDLVATLAAHARPGTLREGAELVSFAQDRGRVHARFADGGDETLDVLIGADGFGSRVRAQLLGDMPARLLNQQASVGWVATPPGLLERGIATATIGRGPRFWYAPLANGAFWYATLNGTDRADKAALLAAFAGWHAPICDLVAGTDDADMVTTQIRDRPPADRWGDGHVTLLGDAAHPSTPDLGQGACQAIESAAVLAASLAHADSIESGLRAYENARRERTATISRLCWMTSVNSTLENPLLCRLRDGAIRFGLRTVARGHLEWILAGQAS